MGRTLAGIGIAAVVVLVLLLAFSAFQQQRFRGEARSLAADLLFATRPTTPPATIGEADLQRLPVSVQRWLRYSGVIGRKPISSVRLRQRGTLRSGPAESWMPFVAEEYLSARDPAFVWFAVARPLPVAPVLAMDVLREGRGRMRVKPMGVFHGGDFTGTEMTQGALLRWLNELMWFPTSALDPAIQWKAVDGMTAEATLTAGDRKVSALFRFDREGRLIDMAAERYREQNGRFVLTPWSTPVTAYGERAGLRVPVAGEGVWHLPTGDFTYIRLTVTDIGYDPVNTY